MILIGLVFVAGAAALFSMMTMLFFPQYLIMALVVTFIEIIAIVLIFMCVIMLMPVLPFLSAKLGNNMILLINQVNDNIVMVVPSKKATTLDTGSRFGTFIGSPNAVKGFFGFKKERKYLEELVERESQELHDNSLISRIDGKAKLRSFGGTKMYLVYEENAVPPEVDLVRLCQRMENNGIQNLGSLRESIKEGKSPIVFKDLDLKSITRYFEYVNPHYLNVRIERSAAKLAKRYSQTWQKVLPWITMMMMCMLVAAIAYTMVAPSGGGGGSAPQTSAATNLFT